MLPFELLNPYFRAARIRAAALQLARLHLSWLCAEGREELGKLTRDLAIELI